MEYDLVRIKLEQMDGDGLQFKKQNAYCQRNRIQLQ